MKWVELITLRSLGNINGQFVDALLKGVCESDLPTDRLKHLVEIRVYRHSVLDTDLSIHIYWKSELGSQDKSLLGLRFSSALRPLGLLNHSVLVEIAALEFLSEMGTPNVGTSWNRIRRTFEKIYRETPERRRRGD